jgi:hypothetical protein
MQPQKTQNTQKRFVMPDRAFSAQSALHHKKRKHTKAFCDFCAFCGFTLFIQEKIAVIFYLSFPEWL